MKYICFLIFLISFQMTASDFEKAEKLFIQEKYSQAEQLFSKYLEEHPNHTKTIEYLGDIAGHGKDWDKAIVYYKKLKIQFPAPLENEIFAAQLNLYTAKAADYGLPNAVAERAKQVNGDFKNYITEATSKSIFSSKEKVEAFLKAPNAEVITNDPLYVLSSDLMTKLRAKSDDQAKMDNDFGKAYRLLVEGLRESKLNAIEYPDANSTLRLSYGKVRALPADKRNDAKVNNYTTMDGMVKKYKKGDDEFDMPTKIIEMNKAKDYGQYADKDGSMHVNFLTDNDITGGNSGSPVINGKGELIGLAFDGNIEAMAGDVIFDPKLQRTINVDIRYVLWVIDKYSGAKHIIDEMTIVK